MTSQKQFVLGIDGGGTKTFGILADLEGNQIARASGGNSNVQIAGPEGAAREILKVLSDCCRRVGYRPEDVRAVVVGLAGAGRKPDQQRTGAAIRRLARERGVRLRKLLVESDGRIAIEGALGGEPGIVIVAGTGSVGFAKDAEGNIHRAGGWGRLIGDDGSGFVVGREALRAISKHLDARGKPTMLTALAARRFKLSTPLQIVKKVYQNHFDVALLAPIVLHAADKGDKVSKRILDEAIQELVEHVRSLLEKLSQSPQPLGRKKFKLALLGGMLAHSSGKRLKSNYLSRLLKRRINSLFPTIQIASPLKSPAYGAVLLALNEFKQSK